MIYYIFKTQIFTIYLSIAHLTALTFPSKVTDYVGGAKNDFNIYEVNKGLSLVFSTKNKEINRNFISFTQNGKYHFNVIYNDQLSNKDIVIKEAKRCSMFEMIKETKEYQLFECPRSILFINRTKGKVRLNELMIRDKQYLSKGPPIILNGKMIYYRGVTQ